MDSATINAALEAIYQDVYEPLRVDLPSHPIVSYPLLLRVPSAYSEARVKLMVIGQQTRGWHPHDGRTGLQALLDQYEWFNLAKDYRYKSSPFWCAAHELFSLINPEGPERAFLWSNLVRVDGDRNRPTPAIEEAVSSFSLLENEIRLTEPQVVVFFTGPAYDERLRKTFPNLVFEQISPTIFKLSHPKLPAESYRTYHPSYLRRSKQWKTIQNLAELILKK